MARQKRGVRESPGGMGLIDRLTRAEQEIKKRPKPTRVQEQEIAIEQRGREAATLRPEAGEIPVPGDEDETEWEGTLPDLTEAEKAAITANALSAAVPTDVEYDNLWDWIRQDEDRGKKFLGVAPQTSGLMRDMLVQLGEHLYALFEDTETGLQHVGFGGFNPVTLTHAVMHLYLAPTVRGRARELVPQLMSMAAAEYPGRQFVVYTDEPGLMRLYRPLGFTVAYALTWTPPAPQAEAEPA